MVVSPEWCGASSGFVERINDLQTAMEEEEGDVIDEEAKATSNGFGGVAV